MKDAIERLIRKGFSAETFELASERLRASSDADQDFVYGFGTPFGMRMDRTIPQPIDQSDECGEEWMGALFSTINDDSVPSSIRDSLLSDFDASIPEFEKEFETDHFLFKYTGVAAADTDHSIEDALILETSQFAERRYIEVADWLRRDIVSEENRKISVLFSDLGAHRGRASPPFGPIQLNSRVWRDDPHVREATFVHELMHVFQYSFGYRTHWDTPGEFKWFSEGLASWVEAEFVKSVSDPSKINGSFVNPDFNFLRNGYACVPYWSMIDTTLSQIGSDVPAVLADYQNTGNFLTVRDSLLEFQDLLPNLTEDFRQLALGAYSLARLQPELLGDPFNDGIATNFSYAGQRIVLQPIPIQILLIEEPPDRTFVSGIVQRNGTDYFSIGLPSALADNPVDLNLEVSFLGSATGQIQIFEIRLDGSIQRTGRPVSGRVRMEMTIGVGSKIVACLTSTRVSSGYELSAEIRAT